MTKFTDNCPACGTVYHVVRDPGVMGSSFEVYCKCDDSPVKFELNRGSKADPFETWVKTRYTKKLQEETKPEPQTEKRQMKTYIGIKIIKAKAMTAEDAEITLSRELNTENAEVSSSGSHRGYLVEYPDGYQSWSPKKQFDDAYRLVENDNPSPIMAHFRYEHLPEHLQQVSCAVALVACQMDMLPSSAEKSAGLRKLLEAKDCFVRASLG